MDKIDEKVSTRDGRTRRIRRYKDDGEPEYESGSVSDEVHVEMATKVTRRKVLDDGREKILDVSFDKTETYEKTHTHWKTDPKAVVSKAPPAAVIAEKIARQKAEKGVKRTVLLEDEWIDERGMVRVDFSPGCSLSCAEVGRSVKSCLWGYWTVVSA